MTFDSTDVTTKYQQRTMKIESSIGGQLDNFNNSGFTVRATGYFAGKTVADLQWKRVIVEDLDLPLPIIDSFNRANGNFTGATATPDTGPIWTVSASPATNAQIASNQLQLTSGGYVSQNLYATNCVINVTFVSGTRPALVFRSSTSAGTTDGFVLYNDAGTTYLKLVASPFTLLASADGAAAGDVFKVSLSDTTITVLRNGVQLWGIINTNYTANTYIVLLSTYASATGNHIYDAFSATYLNESISKRLFSGYCDYAELVLLNGLVTGFDIRCKESAVLLGRKNTYNTYTAQTDQYIIKDLLSTYFGTLFDTTLVNSFATMPYFASNYEDVLEAIRRICQINGTKLWVDNDDRVHYSASSAAALAPYKFTESGGQDLVSATRALGITKFSKDLSGLLTKVTVIGATETQSFSGEVITTNPYNLQTLEPSVSQFKYNGYSYPVFWTYETDTNNPNDGLAVNTTNTGVANRLILFYEVEAVSGGGWKYAYTYGSSIAMQAGEMVLCSETATGFESQKFNFEDGAYYGVYVDFAGRVSVNKGAGSFGAGQGLCFVALNSWGKVHGETFYQTAPRLFWIGHGWPSTVNPTTGEINYTTATYDTTLTVGYYDSIAGSIPPWGSFVAPTVPSLIPSGSTPHSISYSGPVPIKAVATIDSLRDTYGPLYDGVNHLYFEDTIKDEKLNSTADAKERARILLVERAAGIVSGEFSSMWAQGLEPGMVAEITSATWGAGGFYLMNKRIISDLGAGNGMYKFNFGNYNPEILDYYLKLNKQKDDSQFGGDARTTQTVTQNYLTTTQHYYNRSDTIYDNAGVLLT